MSGLVLARPLRMGSKGTNFHHLVVGRTGGGMARHLPTLVCPGQLQATLRPIRQPSAPDNRRAILPALVILTRTTDILAWRPTLPSLSCDLQGPRRPRSWTTNALGGLSRWLEMRRAAQVCGSLPCCAASAEGAPLPVKRSIWAHQCSLSAGRARDIARPLMGSPK